MKQTKRQLAIQHDRLQEFIRFLAATAPATATGSPHGARRMTKGAWVREAALAYAGKAPAFAQAAE